MNIEVQLNISDGFHHVKTLYLSQMTKGIQFMNFRTELLMCVWLEKWLLLCSSTICIIPNQIEKREIFRIVDGNRNSMRPVSIVYGIPIRSDHTAPADVCNYDVPTSKLSLYSMNSHYNSIMIFCLFSACNVHTQFNAGNCQNIRKNDDDDNDDGGKWRKGKKGSPKRIAKWKMEMKMIKERN